MEETSARPEPIHTDHGKRSLHRNRGEFLRKMHGIETRQ